VIRPACLALLLLVLGCPSTEPDPEPTPAPVVDEGPGPLAADVTIRRIALNQSVEVAIVQNDALVEPPAVPPVAGRGGIVRVYLDTEDGFEPRTLLAELTLRYPDGRETLYTVSESIDGPSLREDLNTTLDFGLLGEEIVPGLEVSAAVRETSGARDGGPETSRWPFDGEPADIGVSDWGGVVRLAIIPVRYTADGSDRMPDVSPQQIEVLRSWMQRLYPVHSVVIDVDEEHVTELDLDGSSDAMSDLLEDIRDLRGERGIPFDVYTYGMVQPAETLDDYCQGGCTTGIAYRVGNPNTHWLRSGVGIGFSGDRSARTLVHEIGHQHDRGHAPCGNPSNIDTEYPYNDARLGSWGYDAVEGSLVDPDEAADFMAYCDPIWVSDYQFAALWTRIAQVEGLSGTHAREEADWLTVSWRSDAARVRGLRRLGGAPDGAPMNGAWLGVDGEIGPATAFFQDIADAPGSGTVFVEPPPTGAVSLRLADRVIAL